MSQGTSDQLNDIFLSVVVDNNPIDDHSQKVNMSIVINETVEPECGGYEAYDSTRFVFIMLASTLALIGCFNNFVLLIVFLRRHNTNLYTIVLAVLDFTLCFAYLFCFGLDAIAVFFKNPIAFEIWYMFIMPIFFISKCTQMAIPFMLICATVDRFIVVVIGSRHSSRTRRQRRFDRSYVTLTRARSRQFITTVLLIVVLIIRSPFVITYRIDEYDQCPELLGQKMVGVDFDIYMHPWYKFYDLYIISLLQVFIPFLLLTMLNIAISIKFVRNAHRMKATRVSNNGRYKTSTTMGNTGACMVTPTDGPKPAVNNGRLAVNDGHLAVQKQSVCDQADPSSGAIVDNLTQTASVHGRRQAIVDREMSKKRTARLSTTNGTTITETSMYYEMTPERPICRLSDAALAATSPVSMQASSAMSFTLSVREEREEKRKLKESVSTMLIVVTTYLGCNFLYVVLTLLEYYEHRWVLNENGFTRFQLIASDTITFLFMLCSSMRLAVYFACNHQTRREVKMQFACWQCANLFSNSKKRIAREEQIVYL